MAGIQELIAAFIMLTGLGIEHQPSTASLSEVQRFAPDSANYHLFVDTKSMFEPTFNRLETLAKSPMLVELLGEQQAKQTTQGLAMARTMAKSALGMDPISDLHWLSAWIKFDAKAGRQLLVAAKGKWPSNLFETLSGRFGGSVEMVNGRKLLRLPQGKMALGLASNDVLIVGTAPWIAPRLSKKWRPVKVDTAVKTLFKKKPHIAMYSEPSPVSGNMIKKRLTGKASFMRWPLLAHRSFGVALNAKGFTAHWEGTNNEGIRRAKLTFEGGISMLRAMHHGATGMAKMALAWLPKKTDNPAIAVIHKHGDKLLKLLSASTGDGDFEAKVKVDKRRKLVSLDAQGKSLSHVLPMGGLPFFGAVAGIYVAGTRQKASEKDEKQSAPPKKAPMPPVLTK